MAIKTISGSKKIVTILNRLGHSINYNLVEEYETELVFSSDAQQDGILPEGMFPNPNLNTGLAYDNYDCYVETANGKNTLHDTVGIAYQNIVAETQYLQKSISLPSTSTGYKRKRRAYDGERTYIEPLYKKTRNATLSDGICLNETSQIQTYKKIDNLWIMSLVLKCENVPMWVGWNSRIIIDNNIQQGVWYLPQINSSPTSASTVAETMRRSLEIMEKCHQTYMTVTYDLAIAKIALEIQENESPIYDNLFIQLGAFHIELAYFKVIGKYLDGSGGEYILQESGILALGSTYTFITGKHYNRYS